MFKLNKKIASLAIGGMLLAGSVAGIASADTNTKTTPDQTKDQMYQEFISDFATNLGVTQDQVIAALQATKQQMVQEQVTAGKVTQDQANKILASKWFGFGFMGGHGPGGPGGHGDITNDTKFLNSAASALGITADQLKSELQSGKTLDQIVTVSGMTEDQFHQKMPQRQHKAQKDPATGSSDTADTTTSN